MPLLNRGCEEHNFQGMHRYRRLLAIFLLAVSAMTALTAIPSFGDLKAAVVETASHPCECPDGCPPDGTDCPEAQLCSISHGTLVMAQPAVEVALFSTGAEVFLHPALAPDSISRSPPLHPPKL